MKNSTPFYTILMPCLIEAFGNFADEFWNFPKVVAVVGIAHKNVLAAGGRDATHEGGSVAFSRDGDDSGPKIFCDLLGTVRTAVIGDDDFGFHPSFLYAGLCFAKAGSRSSPVYWEHDRSPASSITDVVQDPPPLTCCPCRASPH